MTLQKVDRPRGTLWELELTETFPTFFLSRYERLQIREGGVPTFHAPAGPLIRTNGINRFENTRDFP